MHAKITLCTLTGMSLLTFACSDAPTDPSTTLHILPATVAVGGTIPRVVHGAPAGQNVVWTSSDDGVATVTAAGMVTGVAEGPVEIRARVGQNEGRQDVHVVDFAFTHLAMGARTACGIDRGQQLYCWGYGSVGSLGPLPESETCGPELSRCRTTPHAGIMEPMFRQVTGGHGGHMCGLTADGRAWCWGNNQDGALASSSDTCPTILDPVPCSYAPVAVPGDLRFTQISAGAAFTCGIDDQGAAFCWGRVLCESAECSTPTLVSNDLRFRSVSSGFTQACGITDSADAYCWDARLPFEPVKVPGSQSFTTLSVALYHACAVTVEGDAFCWGQNQWGQLGNGSYESADQPVPVTGEVRFRTTTAGLEHTCALSDAGAAWCWGENDGRQVQGQLGAGNHIRSSVPVPVAGGHVFVELHAGRQFTCGRTGDGRVFCWGDNRYGQLGHGDPAPRNSNAPVGVAGET